MSNPKNILDSASISDYIANIVNKIYLLIKFVLNLFPSPHFLIYNDHHIVAVKKKYCQRFSFKPEILGRFFKSCDVYCFLIQKYKVYFCIR